MDKDYLFPNFPFKELIGDELQQRIDEEKKKMRRDKSWQLARNLFIQDDEPFEMSPGELAIFNLISKRQCPYSQILCSTQYGKTLTVARAVLARITTFPEEWLVVVPNIKRGKILLNYIIKDTSNNDYFKKKLVGINIGDRTVLNRLLEEKSKLKLTYQVVANDNKIKYSSVEILTAEAKRRTDTINAIMGFGGRNIILEESSLMDDEIDAGTFRMLAGKGEDIFLTKIGNPFYRNHFLKSWEDPDYKKIFINYKIALAEGRYTKRFIEKAKEKPKFDVLFECKFPSIDAIDSRGYSPLLLEEDLKFIDDIQLFGELHLGCDVAGGGRNFSVIVLRGENGAKLLYRERNSDTMSFVGTILEKKKEIEKEIGCKIYPQNILVDAIGLGKGVYDRLNEQLNNSINGVNAGEVPEDKEDFINIRAQMYWRMAEWIKKGGKLIGTRNDWKELLNIKYKIQSDRKVKIMSKEDMLAEGIESPDVADGLALTFAPKKIKKMYITKQFGGIKPFYPGWDF